MSHNTPEASPPTWLATGLENCAVEAQPLMMRFFELLSSAEQGDGGLELARRIANIMAYAAGVARGAFKDQSAFLEAEAPHMMQIADWLIAVARASQVTEVQARLGEFPAIFAAWPRISRLSNDLLYTLRAAVSSAAISNTASASALRPAARGPSLCGEIPRITGAYRQLLDMPVLKKAA